MAKAFLVLAFLLAFIFETSNAGYLSPWNPLNPYGYYYTNWEDKCKSAIIYMSVECQPYFMDKYPNTGDCCSAFESIVADFSGGGCFCDTMKEGNSSMDGAMAIKLPTLCNMTDPCHHSNAPGLYSFGAVFSMLAVCFVLLSNVLI